MGDEDFFSHFDNDGHSIVDRIDVHEIVDWKKIGENLFMSQGFDSPADVAIDSWMKSRTHRDNILDGEWTDTGIGIFTTEKNRIYVTQTFMRK